VRRFLSNYFDLLFTFGRQSVINDAIDEWCKRLQACICAKGRYFEHLMRMFTFLRSEEKSSDFFEDFSLVS